MLTISRANSMHFVKVDGLLPNAENSLSFDEKYAGNLIRGYCQKWNSVADVVTVQMVSDSDTVPTVEVFNPSLVNSLTPTLVATYAATAVLPVRYYFELEIDFTNELGTLQYRVTQGTDVWLSEKQQISDLTEDLANGDIIKIEYTNHGNESKLPNTQIDYTTGIEFFMYVEAVLKDVVYQGEDKMFTNIGEKILIESQLFKARRLQTYSLPEFMTDKIAIAGKCFTFIVNDLQYTTDGMPEVTSPAGNLRFLTWTLVHSVILGLTTDDRSLTPETMDGIITRNTAAIVDTWTFIAPAGYLIHTVVAGHGVGSADAYALTMGYTLHGTDILDALDVPFSPTNTTAAVHDQPAFETDTTVYVEISGAGAVGKIYVQLLRNTVA